VASPEVRYRPRAEELARWRDLPALDPGTDRWGVYPGGQVAQVWQLLAALRLDPRLRLLLPWDTGYPTDGVRAAGTLEVLRSAGLAGRVVPAPTPGPMRHEDVRRYAVSSGAVGAGAVCGHGWAATSIVSAAALRTSAGDVVGDLRDVLAAGERTSPGFLGHRAEYDRRCLAGLDALRPGRRHLLVNMRWIPPPGPNAEHNITELRFAQILAAAAAEATPVDVVRIGLPETWAGPACAWVHRHEDTTLPVDPYCDREPGSSLWGAITATRLFQTYFWRRVADLPEAGVEIVGMVGGRSVSMDVAAFMGVRTATWDRPAPGDRDYLRLHWSAPFHTIVHDDVEAGLDQAGLRRWLRGEDLVPVLAGDPVTGTRVGTLERYGSDTAAFDALWYP
jgi:hypothetical protein